MNDQIEISQGEVSQSDISPNIGLDQARATEAAALAAGRWAGLGNPTEAERVSTEAMIRVLQRIEMDGVVALGEAERVRPGKGMGFATGQRLGTGRGPAVDLLAKAIEGSRLLAGGYPARCRPWRWRRPDPSGRRRGSITWKSSLPTRRSRPRWCPSAWTPRPRGRWRWWRVPRASRCATWSSSSWIALATPTWWPKSAPRARTSCCARAAIWRAR